MRYWFLVAVFFSCLVLQVGSAFGTTSDPDVIPLEAIKIPFKDRKKVTHLAQHNVRPSLNRAYPPFGTDWRGNADNFATDITLIPMLGSTLFGGKWNERVNHHLTTGLALDVPLSSLLSLELEAGYGGFNFSYLNLSQKFNQWWGGGSMKMYVIRSRLFRPYFSAGMQALNYEDVVTGNGKSNRWMGYTQVATGVDVGLFDDVSFGVRGGWYAAAVNRTLIYYGFPDAEFMNADFFRVMGTLKVAI